MKFRTMSPFMGHAILEGAFDTLVGMDPKTMTTFELNLLREIAEDLPNDLPTVGIETKERP